MRFAIGYGAEQPFPWQGQLRAEAGQHDPNRKTPTGGKFLNSGAVAYVMNNPSRAVHLSEI